ncbi:MAG TPA: hypothetical protein VN828_15940, partial [Acidobacteriaceae bacterium]|nr:hypothetical protein [Acidobacteriaceae bacterium]
SHPLKRHFAAQLKACPSGNDVSAACSALVANTNAVFRSLRRPCKLWASGLMELSRRDNHQTR